MSAAFVKLNDGTSIPPIGYGIGESPLRTYRAFPFESWALYEGDANTCQTRAGEYAWVRRLTCRNRPLLSRMHSAHRVSPQSGISIPGCSAAVPQQQVDRSGSQRVGWKEGRSVHLDQVYVVAYQASKLSTRYIGIDEGDGVPDVENDPRSALQTLLKEMGVDYVDMCKSRDGSGLGVVWLSLMYRPGTQPFRTYTQEKRDEVLKLIGSLAGSTVVPLPTLGRLWRIFARRV